MTNDPIWYAAYGSNLLTERLRCYVEGDGFALAQHGERGCRDPSPPRAEQAAFLPHRLLFAGSSQRWSGGTAFLDPQRDSEAQTLGRLWLLTAAQFADLVRQENGDAELLVDPAAVPAEGSLVIGPGAYGRLLDLGERDGHRILTCTGSRGVAADDCSVPGPAYLTTVVAGLRETYALNMQGTRRYLLPVPGIAGSLEGRHINDAWRGAEQLLDG